MKQDTSPQNESITKSLLQGIMDQHKENLKAVSLESTVQKQQPAELDQDAGGAYNADGTYPQM